MVIMMGGGYDGNGGNNDLMVISDNGTDGYMSIDNDSSNGYIMIIVMVT